MGAGDYTLVQGEEETQQRDDMQRFEEVLVKRASRGVYMLCLVQFFLFALVMLSGLVFFGIFGTIFVWVGVSGVRTQRYKSVLSHFIFSVMTYVFTVIISFLVIMSGHVDLIGFLFALSLVLCQGMGIRHSRMLVALLKRRENLAASVQLSSISTSTDGPVNISQSYVVLPVGQAPPAGYVPVAVM